MDTARFRHQVNILHTRFGDTSFAKETIAYSMITKYLIGRQTRERKEIFVDTKLYQFYIGTYELLPAPIKISVVGNKLMVEGPILTSAVELFPEAKNKFFLKFLNVQIEFLRNKEGVIDRCVLYIEGNKYECKKLSS
ncbi:MAG: hypothetical protein ACR2KX_14720 [Chitinophagaceae bacterium]